MRMQRRADARLQLVARELQPDGGWGRAAVRGRRYPVLGNLLAWMCRRTTTGDRLTDDGYQRRSPARRQSSSSSNAAPSKARKYFPASNAGRRQSSSDSTSLLGTTVKI